MTEHCKPVSCFIIMFNQPDHQLDPPVILLNVEMTMMPVCAVILIHTLVILSFIHFCLTDYTYNKYSFDYGTWKHTDKKAIYHTKSIGT